MIYIYIYMMNSCTRWYVEWWCMMMNASLTWHGVSPAKWTELQCHLTCRDAFILPSVGHSMAGSKQCSYTFASISSTSMYMILHSCLLCQLTIDIKVSINMQSRSREGWPTLDLVEVHFSLPKNVREETCRFKAGENVVISINDPVSTSARDCWGWRLWIQRTRRVFNDHEHKQHQILSPDTDFNRKSKERRGRYQKSAGSEYHWHIQWNSLHIVYTEVNTCSWMQQVFHQFLQTMELQQHLAGASHPIHVPPKNPPKELLPFKLKIQVANPCFHVYYITSCGK